MCRQMPRVVKPSYSIVRRQCRKVWEWYARKDKSILEMTTYLHYRGLVEKAIAEGPPDWKEKFILP